MKKIIYLYFATLGLQLTAQVGINTTTPQRNLDINGDLTIRSTQHKAEDPNYNRILATNGNGEIEYWTKDAVLTKMADGVRENKLMYFGTAPTGNVIVPCGRFDLRFSTATVPQIRINKTSVPDTTIYFTRIRKRNSASNGFSNSGRTLRTNETVILNRGSTASDNEDGWKSIGTVSSLADGEAGKNYQINTQDEYYISYPGQPNTYRVTFLARTMTQPASQPANSYTMICEKF